MNRQDWMGFPRTAVAVAVAVVAAAPALAQNTTSAVGGTVVGLDGKPIGGAAVTVVHTESRSTASTVTDAGGRWVARGLRVGGPYTITVTKAGDTEKREGVYLALAETLSLDLLLGRSTSVTVTGSRILSDRFAASNIGTTTSIGARDLANLSSLTGNLQDFARIDPRISQTDKERGEISALGQNSRFNTITIDGVNISDTFGLESNNLPTAKQPISAFAIQSVQINLSNYDVTQRGYTGANINAVTKSGTNEFHGAAYGAYRDEGMAGARYSRPTTAGAKGTYTKPAPFTYDQKGFVFGGPIIQDKLFFFVGYEETKNSIASIDFGPIGSAKTNVGISPALITGLQQVAQSTYNIDLGTTEPPGQTYLNVKDALVKLDWSISDSQRATLRFTRTKQDEPIFPNFGVRALSLSSNWYTQQKSLDTAVAQLFSDWSPSFSTEVRASYRDYKSEPKNNSALPQIAFDVDGTFNGSGTQRTLFTGTERSRHFNKLFTKTVDGFLGGNWTVGSHELKFGGELSQNKIYNAFLQDAYGQYKFQCESAYTYTTPLVNAAGAAATCATATQATVEAAIIENFRLGRASAYQAQLPLPGKTLDDGVAKWNLNNYGLFLQDNWTVAPKFTISAGARVDIIAMPDKPVANTAAGAAKVAGVSTGRGVVTSRQSGGFGYDNTVTPDGDTLVQPRIGFNWDLGGKDRKLQLRGGFGLFQGAAANVWISNPFSNTGTATSFYGCGPASELSGGTTRAGCSTTASSFNPNVNAQTAIGANPAASVDFLDPGLSQPSVWKSNLAIDVEGPAGLVFGAEWVHTKVNKGVYYKHLNLGDATFTGSDGRELYYNSSGYNTACWGATGGAGAAGCAGTGSAAPTSRALSNLSYANVLLATGTNKGVGDAITVGVAQQPFPGVTWTLAYTKTRATEVSPLTSSVANSNWAARSIFNPNEDVAADSAYLIRDRVSGTLNMEKALFGKLKSTFGVTYEGRRGKTYSWTYINDLNGDGQSGNDLMYIPRAFGSGDVSFASVADEQRFWNVVNAYPELRNSAGKVVGRNSGTAPWVNNFDVRLTQEIPGFASTHKAKIKFDIFNFGNLINRKWGRIDEVAFQSAGGAARSFVNYRGIDANGRYIYAVSGTEDYTTRQTKGESQWAAQISLSYEF